MFLCVHSNKYWPTRHPLINYTTKHPSVVDEPMERKKLESSTWKGRNVLFNDIYMALDIW